MFCSSLDKRSAFIKAGWTSFLCDFEWASGVNALTRVSTAPRTYNNPLIYNIINWKRTPQLWYKHTKDNKFIASKPFQCHRVPWGLQKVQEILQQKKTVNLCIKTWNTHNISNIVRTHCPKSQLGRMTVCNNSLKFRDGVSSIFHHLTLTYTI